MVLGLLSMLAPFGSFFWFIPLLAIVISAYAWRLVNLYDRLSGKNLALFGLIFGALFGSMAVTSHYVRKSTLQSSAKILSDGWLALLSEENVYEAHQLTLLKGERQPLEADLDFFYQEKESAEESPDAPILIFKSSPIIQWFRQHAGSDFTVRFVDYRSASFGEETDSVSIDYEVIAKSNGNSQSQKFTLYLVRADFQSEDTAGYLWQVANYEITKD